MTSNDDFLNSAQKWKLVFDELRTTQRIPPNFVCAVLCLVPSAVPDSLQPRGLLCPWLLCPRDSPGKNPGGGCHFLLQGTFPTQDSNPGQVDSLLYEPPGKTNNTGAGSLSLLEGNFPTEESNWGFLHCRQIVYQLSYPRLLSFTIKLSDFYSLVGLSFLKSVCKFFPFFPITLQTRVSLLSP